MTLKVTSIGITIMPWAPLILNQITGKTFISNTLLLARFQPVQIPGIGHGTITPRQCG
jgi:hypothetical protein